LRLVFAALVFKVSQEIVYGITSPNDLIGFPDDPRRPLRLRFTFRNHVKLAERISSIEDPAVFDKTEEDHEIRFT